MDDLILEPIKLEKDQYIPENSMLWDHIKLACRPDKTAKLIFIAITSKVEGKLKSQGLPFGQGKSICASILAAQIYQAFDPFLGIEPYKTVQENIGYTWEQHTQAVDQGNQRRKLAYIMDDIQRIAGTSKGRDLYVQSWAEFLTAARPFFGVVIFTCPDVDGLTYRFSELVNFEIKIPNEGEYEVQYYKSRSNFKRAPQSIKIMEYKGEGKIPRAPDWYVDWYVKWRQESSYDRFEKDIKNYKAKKDKEKKIPTFREFSTTLRNAGITFSDQKLLEALQNLKENLIDDSDTTTIA